MWIVFLIFRAPLRQLYSALAVVPFISFVFTTSTWLGVLLPDVVILDIGTNDLSVLGPEEVGSSIEELVSSLLNDFAVSVIGVCHVIARGDSFTHWAEFLQRAKILNNYVRVVLDPFPNVFCWSHKDYSTPHKDLYLADGVHVNPLGQYFLYRSYRGAILKASGLLRS